MNFKYKSTKMTAIQFGTIPIANSDGQNYFYLATGTILLNEMTIYIE